MPFTSPEMPVAASITGIPISIVNNAADWVFSKMLRDYPDLKLALSEGGIGWIPYFLERADYVYQHHHQWTHQDFGDKLPSEVFREHFITCFIDDAAGVKNRHAVGIDTITWECDYPHSDTTWPNAPEILAKSMEGVPDDEVNKITYENALRHFRLDPFSVRPREKCTAAALRAESPDVDLSLTSQGGKPPSDGAGPFVTTRDVTTQLATAFSTPAE